MASRPENLDDESGRFRYNAIDPTRTTNVRSSFQSAFRSRWRDVRGRNREWVAGLSRPYPRQLQARYRDFFTTISHNLVLDPISSQQVQRGNHWTANYVRDAYQKGLELARADFANMDAPESVIRDATSFTATHHQDRVANEYQTVYFQTEDHVGYARQEVMDAVRFALENDKSKTWLTDETNANLRAGVKNQYKANANTAVVRAVNEALVTSFQVAGVTQLGVAIETPANTRQNAHSHGEMRVNAAGEVEWETAGDSKVCDECMAIEGEVMRISDVRGSPQFQPPLHPNCRCRLVPLEMELKETGETIGVPDSFSA